MAPIAWRCTCRRENMAGCTRTNITQQGKPLPIAVSFGHHPINFVVASTDVPNRVNEYDYAGGILGRPLQVVKGPLTGLPIPADAEIAIEGEVGVEDVMPEGPFGEWTGYYASNQPAVPVIQIKALYFRNDPILCGFPLFKPSSGDNLHFSLMRSALIWNALDETGVPDVKGVWCHPAGGRFLTVVSIKQRYPGHARQAGMIASQCRSGAYLGPLCRGGRRRCRHHQLRRIFVGAQQPLRPGAVHRNSPARLERAPRPAHPARRSRPQLARGHRRHAPLRVARKVSQGQRRKPGAKRQSRGQLA